MELEWDEAKNDARLVRRSLDFPFAAGVLADPILLVEVDDRRNYGEPRLGAVERIVDLHFTVVFTEAGNAAYPRRVRHRNGLTQTAFAARIGVPLDKFRNHSGKVD